MVINKIYESPGIASDAGSVRSPLFRQKKGKSLIASSPMTQKN